MIRVSIEKAAEYIRVLGAFFLLVKSTYKELKADERKAKHERKHRAKSDDQSN